MYDSATNGKGQLATVSWGASPTQNKDTFVYDSFGRLTKQTRLIDGRSYALETTGFDVLSRPLTVKYPTNEVVTLTYDREGENTLKAGSNDLVSALTYNARGQMLKLDRAGSAVDTTYAYYNATGTSGNSNFRLKTMAHGGNTDVWPDMAYTYDTVGNILTLNTTMSGSSPDNQTFGYDDLSRLTSAGATGGAANYGTVSYVYNEIGNITSFEGKTYDYNNVSGNPPGCTAPTQTMPHAVRKVGASDYFCYDGNGNMTKRIEGGVTYDQQFDVENRLVSMAVGSATTTFAYDASGQRVKTVEPGGKTTYFPFGNYEETVVGGSTIKRSSYALAGQVVAFRVAGDPVATNNGLFFIYGDHLGSTSMLQKSGEAQHLAGSLARYRPFGSYRTAPTQTITDRDFTGQRENRELGLLYYNARFYHPASGRFISPDFLVPSPSDPQSLNRYSYVRNSPLSRVDPTGHVDCGLLGEASDMRSCKSSKRNELSQRLAKVAYDDPLVRHSRLSQNEIASNISLILEKGESYDLTASQMAYVLTTAQAETHMGFWMYEAIGEETANKKYGPGSPNSTILGNTQPGDGYKYRGRGFVQLTGRANYTARGYAENPDAVADPAVAVHLLLGITTSRLDGYTDENGHVDYYNARDLVNGDKDDKKFGNAYTGTVGEYFMETAPLFEALLVEYGYGSNE